MFLGLRMCSNRSALEAAALEAFSECTQCTKLRLISEDSGKVSKLNMRNLEISLFEKEKLK